MNLTYDDEELKEICHDPRHATRKLGKKNANKLHAKIALLDASKNLRDLIRFDPKAHWLQGARKWDFSIPLTDGISLVLTAINRAADREHSKHEEMKVKSIEDYHK